ncbi:MAG: sensor histidine kinase [Actinomycetota bacterium]
MSDRPSSSSRRQGRRRFLERFPSIRAKLAFVIVFAVGMTVLLTYLLLGYALRGSERDAEQLRLIDAARLASTRPSYEPPGGVTILRLTPDGKWRGTPPEGLPVIRDRGFHIGSTEGYNLVALPAYDDQGRWLGTVYAVRKLPTSGWLARLRDTFGFLKHYWWQLLLGGAIAAGGALAMARLLSLGLTRPLREMARAAGEMARGDYGARVSADSRDEVGQLAAAFNRMASELEQVERLRRDLVANVSHELKTPISALRAHLENLLDGVEQPDPETLQIMLQQSERLSRLVEQLLDLSRLESGDVPMELAPVRLGPLIDQVVGEVQVAAHGRGASVPEPENLVPADAPAVMADRERVHQVLYNLLDNAVRFTPPTGSVSVSAAVVDGRCEVRVSDTGPGIPAEHLPFVFERFYRADAARTRGRGGTGIGLAIVRSVVEAHGGRVRAESEPGRGSAFTFDLPLAETEAGGAMPPEGPGPAAAGDVSPAGAGGRPAVGASASTGGTE